MKKLKKIPINTELDMIDMIRCYRNDETFVSIEDKIGYTRIQDMFRMRSEGIDIDIIAQHIGLKKNETKRYFKWIDFLIESTAQIFLRPTNIKTATDCLQPRN